MNIEHLEEIETTDSTMNSCVANNVINANQMMTSQSNQFMPIMLGYSRPAAYSGLSVLQGTTSPSHVTKLRKCTDHDYFEELDGVVDDNRSDECEDASEASDSTLMRVLKMPAVDIAVGVAVTALLVRGPLNW